MDVITGLEKSEVSIPHEKQTDEWNPNFWTSFTTGRKKTKVTVKCPTYFKQRIEVEGQNIAQTILTSLAINSESAQIDRISQLPITDTIKQKLIEQIKNLTTIRADVIGNNTADTITRIKLVPFLLKAFGKELERLDKKYPGQNDIISQKGNRAMHRFFLISDLIAQGKYNLVEEKPK